MPHSCCCTLPGKIPGIHCVGWASGLVWTSVENLVPPPGFNPQTTHHIASHFTGYAILAHHCFIYIYIVITKGLSQQVDSVVKHWA
jgi:hypothetical protein